MSAENSTIEFLQHPGRLSVFPERLHFGLKRFETVPEADAKFGIGPRSPLLLGKIHTLLQ